MADQKQSVTEELGMRTAKVASFLISGRFIGLVISAVMFIVVARLLAPHDYGIYVLIMSAVGFIATLGSPNFGLYLKEKVPHLESGGKRAEVGVVMNDVLLLCIIIGGALTVAGIVLGNQISQYLFHTSAYSIALDVGLSSVLLNILFSTFSDGLVSINRGAASASTNILHSATQAITSVLLVLAGFGIAGAVAGFTIGLLVGTSAELLIIHRKYPLRLGIAGLRARFAEAVNFSKHLAVSSMISTLLMNLAALYLGLLVPAATIGDYGVASKVGLAIDTSVGAIGLALIPMFSEAATRRHAGVDMNKLFDYSIYFSFLFVTPAIVMIVIFSHEIVFLLFGTAYLGATLYMQLMGLGLLLTTFSVFGFNFIVGSGKPKKVLKYAIISGLIELAAMIVLTNYFGVIGMIIAVFYVGSLVPAALYLNYIHRSAGRLSGGKLLRVFAANLIVAVLLVPLILLNLLTFVGLAIGIVLYLLLYPIIAGWSRAVGQDEIKMLRTAGEGMPVIGPILRAILDYASMFAAR